MKRGNFGGGFSLPQAIRVPPTRLMASLVPAISTWSGCAPLGPHMLARIWAYAAMISCGVMLTGSGYS